MNLDKIPFKLFLILLCGYLAFDYYNFKNAEDSDLITRQNQLISAQGEVQKLKKRLHEVEEFHKMVEEKRQEVRQLGVQLDKSKGLLGEYSDVAGVMKAVISQAQETGLTVMSLKPTDKTNLDYVVQQSFEMNFSGVYVRVLAFMDRLTKLKRILHVDNYTLKPSAKQSQKFVELDGGFKINAFYYLRSKVDDLGKGTSGQNQVKSTSASAQKTNATTAPASAPAGGSE